MRSRPTSHWRALSLQDRGLGLRLALAVLVAGVAWAVLPDRNAIILAWLAMTVTIQTLEFEVSRRILARGRAFAWRWRWLSYAMMLPAGGSFNSIAMLFWFEGGDVGRVAAMLLLIGSVVNDGFYLVLNRALVAVGAFTALAYMWGMPFYEGFHNGRIDLMALGVGAVVLSGMILRSVYSHVAAAAGLRRSLTEARMARRQAERATEAKSRFLAVMSHEIRTPLNAVVASAHLFDRPDAAPEQRKQARLLRNAADALSALLNDVLDISRVEAGKLSIEPIDAPLRDTLSGHADLWRPSAEAKALAFRLELDPSLPDMARFDPLRLRQIVFNLLSNAIKFTARGSVTLRARHEDGVLRLEVIDTGVGVPEEELGRIFESFEQARGDGHPGGAGLGLAISRRLAELMGGTLEAESVEGEGATFRLLLPMPASAADAVAAPEPAAVDGMRVLVADDNAMNRNVLQALLEEAGCIVTMVEDGAAAVAAAAAPFDAILLDMRMPALDGFQAMQRIRYGDANAATPLIALTANVFSQDRAAWRAAGGDHYLTKPIDPFALRETLARARDGRAVASGR